MSKRKICILITLCAIGLLLLWELFGSSLTESFGDPFVDKSIGMTVTRLLGSAVFLTIIVFKGYRILNPFKNLGRKLLPCIPALLVVVNNLPIHPLCAGLARVETTVWRLLLLGLECFSVALFEESCFRGVVLTGFLKARRETKWGQLLSVLLTSAVFGAVHLINLFIGSSPVAVLMQIGYSFLIGAMCSVVLFRTGNLWLCVFLHAVFNFNGQVVPSLGDGIIWEPVTVTVTAALAVFATAFLTVVFFRMGREDVDGMYAPSDA